MSIFYSEYNLDRDILTIDLNPNIEIYTIREHISNISFEQMGIDLLLRLKIHLENEDKPLWDVFFIFC